MKLFTNDTVNKEVREYLQDSAKCGSCINRIRDLILHIYNSNRYNVDIFGMLRNCDKRHRELALNIIEYCSLDKSDTIFLMIDDGDFINKIIDARKED